MGYVSQVDSGRKSRTYTAAGTVEKPIMESVVDLPRFAKDIAKELGGRITTKTDYPAENQSFQVVGADGKAVEVGLTSNRYSSKGKVHVFLSAPDIKWEDRNQYDKDQRTESANVSPDGRPVASIAKDIKKRVIDASAAAIANQRLYAAGKQEARQGIQQVAKLLQTMVKDMTVRIADDKLSASFYLSKPYISGNVSADGKVRIERMDSMSLAKFGSIVATMKSKEA